MTIDPDRTFMSSDLHLCHANLLTFTSNVNPNVRVRPEFEPEQVEEMNEHIIAQHNKVVGPDDVWYCLGDLIFKMPRIDEFLSRMNGRKKYLILGNHEGRTLSDFQSYFKHFRKVSESCRFGNIVFTHRPVLLGGWEAHLSANVHGHIHEANVPDARYINVGMEQIDYTPVSVSEIINTFITRGVEVDLDA